MDLVKSIDYFDPTKIRERCHIIGCGSVGSTIAELLVRLGLTQITLYDFDKVVAHNIANQMFAHADIGVPKVEAVKRMLCAINPECENDIELCPEGWKPKTRLNGYVFLCVDNIDLRRQIATENKFNRAIKAMFDFRTRLEDAQHYAANWSDPRDIDNFISTMDFSHDEAKEATPVTACNVEMGVAPTVRVICSLGVTNFMNFVRSKGTLVHIAVANPFSFTIDTF